MAAILAGCVASPSATTPQPASTGSGTASPGLASDPEPARLSDAELRYRLIDAFGLPWYCDPDDHPVTRDEREQAATQFDEIRQDRTGFAAILRHLDLDERGPFGPEDQLAVYREWKVLNAIQLVPESAERYRFDYLAQPTSGGRGTRSSGSIDASGEIDVQREVAADAPACPICLARGTLIGTPLGPRPVELLKVGDAIWSFDAQGRQARSVVVRIGSMPAPSGHRVVRLELDDGRQLTASPGHPLADGRRLGELRVGDGVDGARVVSARLADYQGGSTFDLLASGPTGGYLAGGIPLGSTLPR